jgi:hypothetical protein
LVGRTRAAVLKALADACTTTELAQSGMMAEGLSGISGWRAWPPLSRQRRERV